MWIFLTSKWKCFRLNLDLQINVLHLFNGLLSVSHLLLKLSKTKSIHSCQEQTWLVSLLSSSFIMIIISFSFFFASQFSFFLLVCLLLLLANDWRSYLRKDQGLNNLLIAKSHDLVLILKSEVFLKMLRKSKTMNIEDLQLKKVSKLKGGWIKSKWLFKWQASQFV